MTKTGKTNKDLRKFGITMAVACAVFGGLFWWQDKSVWTYFFYVAGAFLLSGLAVPRALAPIEWAWMKMAHAMGIVMTNVILILTYFLAITPIAILMKVFGKDPLNRKFDRDAASYWEAVDPEGPISRPDKPY